MSMINWYKFTTRKTHVIIVLKIEQKIKLQILSIRLCNVHRCGMSQICQHFLSLDISSCSPVLVFRGPEGDILLTSITDIKKSFYDVFVAIEYFNCYMSIRKLMFPLCPPCPWSWVSRGDIFWQSQKFAIDTQWCEAEWGGMVNHLEMKLWYSVEMKGWWNFEVFSSREMTSWVFKCWLHKKVWTSIWWWLIADRREKEYLMNQIISRCLGVFGTVASIYSWQFNKGDPVALFCIKHI